MPVVVGDLTIEFACGDRQAESALGLLFHDWPQQPGWLPEVAPPSRLSKSVLFSLSSVATLSGPDSKLRLIFSDQASHGSEIQVLEDASAIYLRLGSEAIAKLPRALDIGERQVVIEAQITHYGLQAGRMEDLFFSCLAPILRRRGFFMLHGFAVKHDNRALLLVGHSGSGKTTTGLRLVSEGWQYLANDVVLLRWEESGLVHAWPTPGVITLSPHSRRLLPELPWLTADDEQSGTKQVYPAKALVGRWGSPAPVMLICFPKVKGLEAFLLRQQMRSVALARLMEGSIDRWDTSCLENHIELLEHVGSQARVFDLDLGENLNELSRSLVEVLRD